MVDRTLQERFSLCSGHDPRYFLGKVMMVVEFQRMISWTMGMKVLRQLIVCAYISILFFLPAFAQAGKPIIHDLVTLLSLWAGDEIGPNISTSAAKYIDYEGMAELAVGSSVWTKLPAGQRREFVITFRKLVEQRYYPRWHKIFSKGKLVYHDEVTVNGDTLVKTFLTVGKKEDLVIWRLHSAHGELKIVSLSVADKDLLKRLRERFHRHLDKGGFDGMMAWLKDKLTDTDVGEETSMAP